MTQKTSRGAQIEAAAENHFKIPMDQDSRMTAQYLAFHEGAQWADSTRECEQCQKLKDKYNECHERGYEIEQRLEEQLAARDALILELVSALEDIEQEAGWTGRMIAKEALKKVGPE